MKEKNIDNKREVEHGEDYGIFESIGNFVSNSVGRMSDSIKKTYCNKNKHFSKCSFVDENWQLTKSKSKSQELEHCNCGMVRFRMNHDSCLHSFSHFSSISKWCDMDCCRPGHFKRKPNTTGTRVMFDDWLWDWDSGWY